MTGTTVRDFVIRQRVQAHPATDVWLAGDRYGTVERIGHLWVHVRMDRSGALRRFAPRNLVPVSTSSHTVT